jgi:hypothetical protein
MANETNPVQTATLQTGMKGPLDLGMSSDDVTVTGGIGGAGSGVFGSNYDWSSFSEPNLTGINLDSSGFDLSSGVSSALSAISGGSGISNILNSLGLSGSNLGALAPELAVAGVGLAQAKSAQSDAAKQAAELKGPSQNMINAGNDLLAQFKSGKLTPQQQSFVDFTSQEGKDLIDSGAGLKAIATQAFGDYSSGKLPQADEIKLQQQVAAQKQQIASQLGQAGMQDSSVLDAYNQQIDNQALVTRQNMLDARFQTGVQAYNTWLNSTVQGIAVKQAGAQFAETAFQDMMKDALELESAGMSGLTQAIALTIQSDNQLSESVSQLMGNLAAAYAYTVSGPGQSSGGGGGAGGSAAAGGSGGLLGSLLGKAANTAVNKGIGALFGGGGSAASGSISSILAGGSPALASVGTGADVSVLGSVSDALGGSAAGGGAAAGGAAAGAGAAAGGVSAAHAGAALGAGAPGAFAAGNAAAGSAGTSAGLAVNPVAGFAAPVAAAALPFAIGMGATAKTDQGNVAMKGWAQATGATFKANPSSPKNNGSTFGSFGSGPSGGKVDPSVSGGDWYDKNGNKMTSQQVATQIYNWAVANGVNPGDFHP